MNKYADESDKKMPIWQNHEQRITALEVTMQELSHKIDGLESTIREGNNEQKEMLKTINERMINEFFNKKNLNLSNGWKLLFSLLGGGGLLYFIIEKLTGG